MWYLLHEPHHPQSSVKNSSSAALSSPRALEPVGCHLPLVLTLPKNFCSFSSTLNFASPRKIVEIPHWNRMALLATRCHRVHSDYGGDSNLPEVDASGTLDDKQGARLPPICRKKHMLSVRCLLDATSALHCSLEVLILLPRILPMSLYH